MSIKVAGRDEEQVRQSLNLLGITQDQYNAICDRWEEFYMLNLPAPFAYGDSGYFRAWSVDCLKDPRCRKILEEEIGVKNLPDFSAYVLTGVPYINAYDPPVSIWGYVKKFFAICWYNYSQRQQYFNDMDDK